MRLASRSRYIKQVYNLTPFSILRSESDLFEKEVVSPAGPPLPRKKKRTGVMVVVVLVVMMVTVVAMMVMVLAAVTLVIVKCDDGDEEGKGAVRWAGVGWCDRCLYESRQEWKGYNE